MTPGFEEARDRAIAAATSSPCEKSKRGVALWHPNTAALWTAHNAPAIGRCDGSEACRAVCPRICVHAEQAVLLLAGRANGRGPKGAELLHVKVVPIASSTGIVDIDCYALAVSGPPSCVECSKLLLAAGVVGVWLFHDEGWRRYEAREFHERTLETLGLYRA